MRRAVLTMTAMLAAVAVDASAQTASDESARIRQWLQGYDAAFVAKDLDKLATFYHPDVTIYEGGGINRGWSDYRDHHLGPELKAFENLQFSHSNMTVHMVGADAAYVMSEYTIKAKMKERDIDGGGLETLVLTKDASGAWKIRHSHTSSKRRPAAAGGEPNPQNYVGVTAALERLLLRLERLAPVNPKILVAARRVEVPANPARRAHGSGP